MLLPTIRANSSLNRPPCCLLQVALPLALSEVESRLRSRYYRQPAALARWVVHTSEGVVAAMLHCPAQNGSTLKDWIAFPV